MSKRSSRRLAVVAGAALAVGSMAPAMAVHVGGNGTADVDVSGVTVPATDSLVDTGLITDLSGTAFGTADQVHDLVLADVAGLQNDVTSLVGDLLGAASSASVDLGATAHASNGGATVEVSGLSTAGSDLLGVVPGPGDVVDGALGLATPVAGIGLGLADTATGLAADAPGIVFDAAGGLLGTGLGVIDGSSADVNVLASLMGSL